MNKGTKVRPKRIRRLRTSRGRNRYVSLDDAMGQACYRRTQRNEPSWLQWPYWARVLRRFIDQSVSEEMVNSMLENQTSIRAVCRLAWLTRLRG